MKKFYLLAGLWAALFSVNAQQVATFEEISLEPGSFYNGSDGAGGFTSGGIWFPNDYYSEYFSWSGFAVSNSTDVTTPGYGNQYSAIADGGAENSENYAVGYYTGALKIEFDEPTQMVGFHVTNSTYAYLAIRDGDSFTKKFGGTDGTDPDYFKLLVSGKDESGNPTDTIDFFLADFRFENSDDDYLVDDWVWLDLSSLGSVTELNFGMESTDVGEWGMNNPTYFCIDNFTFENLNSSVAFNPENDALKIFPNPVVDNFSVELPANAKSIILTESTGRIVYQEQVANKSKVQVSELGRLVSGLYFLKVETDTGWRTEKVLKK
ncbi:Por secretion system C-terminal sorting domain-containing protein [Mariniphaga anaerophila]|uniref:Por secretion system C-terminal sorting domain-containing protein n=1 Tax=Mariniphaga anaerophila TaxID=1484053 RepID=A0A1M4SMA0_9BACT|nr:DUF4465 domain-containing protein [Mariniphaga anaerophila]SHE33315.1 Por secretion system C-terminal sorting domain-containing protein [Mariniphaga anaerophila]